MLGWPQGMFAKCVHLAVTLTFSMCLRLTDKIVGVAVPFTPYCCRHRKLRQTLGRQGSYILLLFRTVSGVDGG